MARTKTYLSTAASMAGLLDTLQEWQFERLLEEVATKPRKIDTLVAELDALEDGRADLAGSNQAFAMMRADGAEDAENAYAELTPYALQSAWGGVAMLRTLVQGEAGRAAWWRAHGQLDGEGQDAMVAVRQEMSGWDRYLYGKANDIAASRLEPFAPGSSD